MKIRLVYHKVMRYIKHELWYIWHCRLRSFFDRKFYNTNYYGEDHKWWMPCCNGNSGGWRTTVCDSLEDYDTGWRYHDAIVNEIEYGEIEDYDWIIRNMKSSRKVSDIMLDGDLFWCTKNGWVNYYACQVFTQEEKDTLDLPIDGVWEKL